MKNNTLPDSSTPPMQNPPGVFSFNPDGCAPFYRFVSISKTDAGIEIWESLPILKSPDYDGDTYTENVIQTYSVHVPYTTESDGETVTKFRTEHRTRTVPIKRKTSKTSDGLPGNSWEHSFTVCVPYTEMIDGIPVTKSRLETRTRRVSENETPLDMRPLLQSKPYNRNSVKFYGIDGRELDIDDVLAGLDGYVPAIQIADAEHIAPYFSRILLPETLLLVVN